MNVEERLISASEAAKLLHVSKPTLRRLIAEGKLEAFKVGQHWRTSEGACDRFVQRECREHAIECLRKR
jgi:excisionase family DNA binding protein